MIGALVMVALCWGVGGIFLVSAIRTPWRPARDESTEARYLPGIAARPWGRARYLLFSTGLATIGLWILAVEFGWI